MEFCFYCSRFPHTRSSLPFYRRKVGPKNLSSRPGSWSPVGTVQDRPRRQPRRRLNAALAGEASARPRRGVAPRAIRACGPGPRWGPFRTDRGGSRDGGLRRACGRGWRTSAPGGLHPGNSRLWSWSPVGTVQDRPRRQPRRRLTPRLWERSAHVRAGGFWGRPPPGISPSLH